MSKNSLYKNQNSIILPFIIGAILGLLAKLVDVPEITHKFPIFDDIFGRFGIWVWTATIIAVFSKKPIFAAIRTFAFFTGMLLMYYSYTILVLKFFPKSQILLWCIISLFTPVCGYIIWFMRKDKWFANILSSLPLTVIFSECYLTGKENTLLIVVYLCMALSLLMITPTNKQRLISLLLALSTVSVLVISIQMGALPNIYEYLLNI